MSLKRRALLRGAGRRRRARPLRAAASTPTVPRAPATAPRPRRNVQRLCPAQPSEPVTGPDARWAAGRTAPPPSRWPRRDCASPATLAAAPGPAPHLPLASSAPSPTPDRRRLLERRHRRRAALFHRLRAALRRRARRRPDPGHAVRRAGDPRSRAAVPGGRPRPHRRAEQNPSPAWSAPVGTTSGGCASPGGASTSSWTARPSGHLAGPRALSRLAFGETRTDEEHGGTMLLRDLIYVRRPA